MELDNSGLFANPAGDPARMDAVEFLRWLDTADEDELRAFGNGTWEPDLTIYYDVFGRSFFDPHTAHRWYQ
jgi:hypothetical protein